MERNIEAKQAIDPEFSSTIDSSISRLFRNFNLRKSAFTQNALSKSFKAIGIHRLENLLQSLTPRLYFIGHIYSIIFRHIGFLRGGGFALPQFGVSLGDSLNDKFSI